jgi:hydrogenase maturation protease
MGLNAANLTTLPPRLAQNERPGKSGNFILGVGNVLRSDDGVGVHAVWGLQAERLNHIEIVDIGTAMLHGLHFLESAERVLVIDAVRGGKAPGTIYLFEPGAATTQSAVMSVHSMGLLQAARLLPPGKAIPSFTVLGVEPASLEYGMELTPAVQQVLPKVISMAKEIVAPWGAEFLGHAVDSKMNGVSVL